MTELICRYNKASQLKDEILVKNFTEMLEVPVDKGIFEVFPSPPHDEQKLQSTI